MALTGVPGAVETTNVAVAPDGTATAVLLTYDDATSTTRIVTSSRPPRGAWSPPVTLSAPSVEFTEPAIAIGPDGTTTIAWRLAPTEDDFVVQATTRTPGHGWSPVQSLSQQSTDEYVAGFTNPEVRLAAATDGTVTAVWPQWITDPNPSDSHFEVQSATRSAAGRLDGTRDPRRPRVGLPHPRARRRAERTGRRRLRDGQRDVLTASSS